MSLIYNSGIPSFSGSTMSKTPLSQAKIILILSVILILGGSLWVGLEKFFHVEIEGAITPPIDAKDEADRLIQTASQNFFYHEYDLAVENYQKAIALFEQRKNFKRAARTYESIGDLHKFFHKAREAEDTYLSAVNYHQKLNNKIGEGRALKRIGDLHMESSQLAEAGEWFGKAAEVVQGAEPHIVKAKIYETQGHYFKKTERISEALDSFQKAKDTFDRIGYPLGYDNISPMIESLKHRQKKELN